MNKCTLCSEGQYLNKNIVFSSRRGDQLVVIEGVPALVCDVCGDRIITEDTAREIEHHADAVNELYGKHGWSLSDAGDAVLFALADNKDKFMTAKELVEYCLKRSKKHSR